MGGAHTQSYVIIGNSHGFPKNLCVTFWTSVKLTLNSPANGPEVTYSKIQNRLSTPP